MLKFLKIHPKTKKRVIKRPISEKKLAPMYTIDRDIPLDISHTNGPITLTAKSVSIQISKTKATQLQPKKIIPKLTLKSKIKRIMKFRRHPSILHTLEEYLRRIKYLRRIIDSIAS